MSDKIFTQQKEILDLKKEILLLKEKIDSIETNVEDVNSIKDPLHLIIKKLSQINTSKLSSLTL